MAQSVKRLTGSVGEFEPGVRLYADSSEPEACFRFCLPLSLSAHVPFLSLSKINIKFKKKIKEMCYSKRAEIFIHETNAPFLVNYPLVGNLMSTLVL